jgi:hypothetical protein
MAEQFAGLPAELLVASKMAARGWNIYSPHRDIRIDFIATKQMGDTLLIRPVQVKGCYYRKRKDSSCYGKSNMDLNQIHDEIVLAIPFFYPKEGQKELQFVAYMPRKQIRRQPNGKYRCQTAMVKDGRPKPRPGYMKFFDLGGLQLMETIHWKDSEIGSDGA